MNTKEYIAQYNEYVLNTYTRMPVVFTRGKGLRLWDIEGNEYLDFFSGWAVSGLGHSYIGIVNALKEQAAKLIHLPNNYYNACQGKLAQEIVENSFDGKVFFCNSGAEAVETAIKFSRIYGRKKGRYEIITMERSFHGRTLAAVTATAQPKYNEPFSPLPEGFKYVKFNDIDAVKKAVSEKTAAILLELIQGEGGINVADKEYLESLREFCSKNDILLIFDEVQTGMGRTGKFFAFQNYSVEPDCMVLAKSLGGGVPIGAFVAASNIADTFKPGMHASTFGGSPLVCKAALAAFKAIRKEKLLDNAVKMGGYLAEKLDGLKKRFGFIKEVRGIGLMLGMELESEGKEIVDEAFKRRLLINCTQGNILRLMPALTVTSKQIDRAVGVLEEVLALV